MEKTYSKEFNNYTWQCIQNAIAMELVALNHRSSKISSISSEQHYKSTLEKVRQEITELLRG